MVQTTDMTNYERIKAMSVEEMARNQAILFYGSCNIEKSIECEKEDFVNGLSPCSQRVLKWLNSEVEECPIRNLLMKKLQRQ